MLQTNVVVYNHYCMHNIIHMEAQKWKPEETPVEEVVDFVGIQMSSRMQTSWLRSHSVQILQDQYQSTLSNCYLCKC